MKKRSFTFVEIVVALVIIGILVTFGAPFYLNSVENAKAKICESNLKALLTALDLYGMEHDQFPASLSALPQEYIREAYKRLLEGKDGWQLELAYCIAGWRHSGYVYAQSGGQFLKDRVAKGNLSIVTCPVDHEGTPAGGGYSYGVNSVLVDMSYADFKALDGDTPILVDCDSAVFTNMGDYAYMRHKRYRVYSFFPTPYPYYQGINKDGTLFRNLSP